MADHVDAVAKPSEALKLGTLVSEAFHLTPVVSAPANFRFGQVSSTVALNPVVLASLPPSLGAIAAFAGNWIGHGFNTIFRPDNPTTPTKLPIQIGGDNILELNLTSETLSFQPSLGSVPNRGTVQGDAFLNGIPYLQSINDVTVAGQSIGIHAEPGLWMAVPTTTGPAEPVTYARMASIPHGTTINAQGTSTTAPGKPTIPPVDITPLKKDGTKVRFPSQTAAAPGTPRIPQDLSAWIAAGTITQAILDDPNTVLRNAIAGQTILSTTTISISTNPATPLIRPGPAAPKFGGGTDNIAFLLGDATAAAPNAQSVQMDATFWIETVQHTLHIPIFKPGQPSLELESGQPGPGRPIQKFVVTPPHEITVPRTITFTTTQIQYSQTVLLIFANLGWPHVSVATLVPAGPGVVPASAWA